MNNIEKLGFDNWFKDKIDLSKAADLKITRVISENKNIQGLGRVASPKSTEKWCGGTFFRKKCGV
jgi:hypothetical protein